MSKFILATFLTLAFFQNVKGDFNSVFDASCRIVTPIKTSGTGIVYGEDADNLMVLSAGHVIVDAANKPFASVTVEFFGTGKRSGRFTSKIVWHKHQPGTFTDLAIIAVPKSAFGKYPLPKPIPFAKHDYEVKDGQRIVSCGSPEGHWPSLWRGHITTTSEQSVGFQPFPAGGRSGSALLDETGEKIIGIIIWSNKNNDQGIAISHKMIYKLTEWKK